VTGSSSGGSVAVLGPPRLATPVAAALALRLAARPGAECALLATDGGAGGPRAPAGRGARRAAHALTLRGAAAQPTGRLVRVALDQASALGDLDRLSAAVAGPAVVAFSGAREPETDAVLAARDALVLVPAPESDALTELAEHSLARLGPPLVTVAPPRAEPLAALLAVTGLAATGGLRAAVEPVLRVLA